MFQKYWHPYDILYIKNKYKNSKNNTMKNVVIKITLPKKFGGIAVKTVIEHSGEIVSSNMVILPPSSNNGDIQDTSSIEVIYEGETLLSEKFPTPKVKPKNNQTL